jgi:hypothetical protein
MVQDAFLWRLSSSKVGVTSPTPAAVTRRGSHNNFALTLTLTLTPTPQNHPGYLRKATAEKKLGKYLDALKTLQAGQRIDLGAFDWAWRALA